MCALGYLPVERPNFIWGFRMTKCLVQSQWLNFHQFHQSYCGLLAGMSAQVPCYDVGGDGCRRLIGIISCAIPAPPHAVLFLKLFVSVRYDRVEKI